ncbi:MAG: hypothetical protein QX196_04020, partial [Methylococcaceae bacterium]
RWLSGAEASKIASTPLSQRLNLMTLMTYPIVGNRPDRLYQSVRSATSFLPSKIESFQDR